MNERKGSITLTFVGDVAALRSEPRLMLEHVWPVFREADIAFCNCEWPLCDRGQPWPGKAGRVVRCPPSAIEAFTAAGIDVVSLANNHTMNYGPEGLLQTIEVLDSAGIAHCGGGADLQAAHRPAILQRNGTRVAFLAYTSCYQPGFGATERGTGLAAVRVDTVYRQHRRAIEEPGAALEVTCTPDPVDKARMEADVRRAKQEADLVVVSWHWGQTIGPRNLLDYQRELGHAAIDAGARLIVGHSPHVLQGIEAYGGGVVCYSLAQFGFDMPEAHVGNETAVVRCTVAGDGLERVSLLPALTEPDMRPRLVNLAEGEGVVTMLENLSRPLGTTFRAERDELVIVR